MTEVPITGLQVFLCLYLKDLRPKIGTADRCTSSCSIYGYHIHVIMAGQTQDNRCFPNFALLFSVVGRTLGHWHNTC